MTDCLDTSSAEFGRLKWRCRRGLLENDLFIEQFFNTHGASLTSAQISSLAILMDLSDTDLLDLFLSRKSLAQIDMSLDTKEIQALLNLFQQSHQASNSQRK